MERLALQFDTLAEAKRKLPASDYAKVEAFIAPIAERKQKSCDKVLADIGRRVYFHVDGNVPPHIMDFMNTVVTRNGSRDEFCGQNPIHYNF